MRTSEIFSGVALNLWDADWYGDGTTEGITLTAYEYDYETGETITDKFVSVALQPNDLPVTINPDDVDDAWYHVNDPNFILLLEVFFAKLLKEAK